MNTKVIYVYECVGKGTAVGGAAEGDIETVARLYSHVEERARYFLI